MNTITKDNVLYTAALAKIAISDDEATSLAKELDAILGYVKQLDSVDTTGLEPTYQVNGRTNALRPDVVATSGPSQERLLGNTPHKQDGLIKVPRVL